LLDLIASKAYPYSHVVDVCCVSVSEKEKCVLRRERERGRGGVQV